MVNELFAKCVMEVFEEMRREGMIGFCQRQTLYINSRSLHLVAWHFNPYQSDENYRNNDKVNKNER